MAKSASPADASPRGTVEAALKRLPQYYAERDLLDALGGRSALVDAYVKGWLPPIAVDLLEGRPERLVCWLLARLIRQGLDR